jgi:uncharacterized protein
MGTSLRLLTIGLVLAAAGLIGCETRTGAEFVRVASGPAGGVWYPLGAKIAQVLETNIPEISTSNMPGGGEANVIDVHRGMAQIGFSYSSTVYEGFEGGGQFPGPQDNVRHFATLYPAVFQTVVRRSSNIRSYDDLAARNISPGKAGWTGMTIAEAVLSAYGITFQSIRQKGGTVHHVDYTDSSALMRDGHVDALMAVAGTPLSTLTDLNFQPGIRFLSVEPDKLAQVLASNPTLIETVIPHTAYEGLTEDVRTIGVATVLVVSAALSEDLVYRMAKVFWESHADFVEVTPLWQAVRREDALVAVGVPVHPGAQRYYDEIGVSAH